MASKEEPSYMMFARANVRGGISSSALIVEALLERIDRIEAELAAYKENTRMHIEKAEGR